MPVGGLVERVGRGLYRWRTLLWCLSGLAGAGFAAGLVLPSLGDRHLLGAVCAGLLALSLAGLGYAFRRPLPRVDPGAPRLRRIWIRARRAGRWALASLMLTLVIAALVFTVRAVGLMA